MPMKACALPAACPSETAVTWTALPTASTTVSNGRSALPGKVILQGMAVVPAPVTTTVSVPVPANASSLFSADVMLVRTVAAATGVSTVPVPSTQPLMLSKTLTGVTVATVIRSVAAPPSASLKVCKVTGVAAASVCSSTTAAVVGKPVPRPVADPLR